METPITLTIHGLTLSGLAGLIWIGILGIRKMQKLLDIFEQFPPHQHVNGKLVFPKGYAPGEVRTLSASGQTN